MDFVDWRKIPREQRARVQRQLEDEEARKNSAIVFHGIADYYIQKAQNAGEFDNLPGAGKPFRNGFLENSGADDMATNIIKKFGGEPLEVSLQKEIQRKQAQIDKHLAYLQHRLRYAQRPRRPHSRSRIRAYQREVHAFEHEYRKRLADINSRILSLNIAAPETMNMQPLPVEQLLQDYRKRFYVFDEE
ncbi:hypothetical protein KDH_05130 [Dictyobacter sp. S3.2.2.5]|uniref:DnaJ homologue subfamily C member 28 conserved domain-containing protein n=1 Tax=Dictyobacter halimunensis TaxID=3026934 RepID=A0ABQ6FHU7_9CHLR|nr:hypothetical protein KDH_05130 [Dictyobacter sp. S3.2.2.5]